MLSTVGVAQTYLGQIHALEQAHEYYENNKFDIIAHKVRAESRKGTPVSD